MVFRGVEDADQPRTSPASDGAGAARVIGSGEEVERVEENIVTVVQRLPQSRYVIPDPDEVSGVLECGCVDFSFTIQMVRNTETRI